MKKWNKLFALLSVALLVLFVAACGNGDDDVDPDTDDAPLGIERPTPQPLPTPDDGEEIVITYAAWNLGTEEENNIQRQMIEAFMDAHPHIIVEIHEDVVVGEGSWEERLSIAASVGNLPDVFMTNDIGIHLQGDWALDITDLANADADFNALPANMQAAMMFNGRVYMVPFAQYMFGYFVNLDLFDSLNLDAPTNGLTIEELEAALRDVTDVSAGTIGTNHTGYFASWYPGSINSDLGFFSFDGENFHLDSPEMIAAINLALELNNNGFVFDGLDDAQRENFNGGWGGEVFFNGEMGLLWDATWALGNIAEQSDFNWEFIGVPGGRPMVTIDVLTIASTTDHAEAAYLLATWMGSGTAGFTRRMEIATEMGTIVGALPISGNQAMLDQFWAMMPVAGFGIAYESMDRALLDPNKVTPGWRMARFYAPTGVHAYNYENATSGQFMHHATHGNVSFADNATRVNDAIQAMFDEVRSELLD